MGLSGILPLFHSIGIYGFNLSMKTFASDRIMIMGLFYLAGAFIYATRIPERWFPGRFDIWVR
jgi:adiponectin receptor